jgi:hypothetical protein
MSDNPAPLGRDLIREENWDEYKTRGFGPIRVDSLEEAQALFGTEGVYTGDAWDEEAQQPLRDNPGKGFYANGEAIDGYIAGWTEAQRHERANVGLRWGHYFLCLIRHHQRRADL